MKFFADSLDPARIYGSAFTGFLFRTLIAQEFPRE